MTEKKTQTVLKLKQAVPYDIQAVLESLFFRSYSTRPMENHSLPHLRNEQIIVTSVDLAKKALDFMNHVRKKQVEGHPYHVKEWQEYTLKNGLTVSTYDNVIMLMALEEKKSSTLGRDDLKDFLSEE